MSGWLGGELKGARTLYMISDLPISHDVGWMVFRRGYLSLHEIHSGRRCVCGVGGLFVEVVGHARLINDARGASNSPTSSLGSGF
jgi:hypothetical protein